MCAQASSLRCCLDQCRCGLWRSSSWCARIEVCGALFSFLLERAHRGISCAPEISVLLVDQRRAWSGACRLCRACQCGAIEQTRLTLVCTRCGCSHTCGMRRSRRRRRRRRSVGIAVQYGQRLSVGTSFRRPPGIIVAKLFCLGVDPDSITDLFDTQLFQR